MVENEEVAAHFVLTLRSLAGRVTRMSLTDPTQQYSVIDNREGKRLPCPDELQLSESRALSAQRTEDRNEL